MKEWIESAALQAIQMLKRADCAEKGIFLSDGGLKEIGSALQRQGIRFEEEANVACALFCTPMDEAALEACKAGKVIVLAFNQAHADIALSLLAGEAVDLPAGSTTPGVLAARMQKHGYRLVDCGDVKGRLYEGNALFSVHGDTLLRQFVESMKRDETADSIVLVRLFVQGKDACEEPEERRPFLSVVTRTQGNRPHELREAAVCLAAQSCRDFEWLVVGHKVPTENQSALMQFLRELPAYLREQTRYICVNTGTRTTPLNVGFEQSRGDYVAILDDDDLVMDDWVEQFRLAAQRMPGRLLHAYCVGQRWERLEHGTVLRAADAPQALYCEPFDWYKQYRINACPPVAVAFPRYAFEQLGVRFDETLNVTEDWDMIMRTAALTGVCDIRTVTCIYRLWNMGASHDVHKQNEWDETYNRLVERFGGTPLLFPAHAGVVPRGHDEAVMQLQHLSERLAGRGNAPEKAEAEKERQEQAERVAAIRNSAGYKLAMPIRLCAGMLRKGVGSLLRAGAWASGGLGRRVDRLADRMCPAAVDQQRADTETLAHIVRLYNQSFACKAVRWLKSRI